ncbi:tyrosine-type recombinase/integrase [Candidatus Woesearchaeota archaeon]|nr:tyrosine-type recombinase/integrase [Candidatus Woesearchaeota archaeon]
MIKIFEQELKKLETELRIRGFTQKTVSTYNLQVSLFLNYLQKDPTSLEEDDIKQYLAHLIAEKKQKPSSVGLSLSSIKFFFIEILKKPEIVVNLKSPKQEKRIPTVLSKEEVKNILNVIENPKHKLMIEIMLSSGLRVAEMVSLKKQDIDFENKLIQVRSGKGKKDRITIISSTTLDSLKQYLGTVPETSVYIFTGQKEHISIKMAQKIIKKAMVDAGMRKNIYCHALRSTFATLLLENGVDIRIIQTLLGHSNLATTERYTKVSQEQLKKVKSPLENI